MRKRFALLLILFLLLALAACAPQNGSQPPAATPPGQASQVNLAGTEWTLVSYGTSGSETPIVTGSKSTLKFGADGRVSGSGGCNSFGGKYQVQGNTVSFSEIISTMMACADDNINRQESQFLKALQSSGKFEVSDSSLKITAAGGQTVLNFTSASAK